jgi:hypothetical protein
LIQDKKKFLDNGFKAQQQRSDVPPEKIPSPYFSPTISRGCASLSRVSIWLAWRLRLSEEVGWGISLENSDRPLPKKTWDHMTGTVCYKSFISEDLERFF